MIAIKKLRERKGLTQMQMADALAAELLCGKPENRFRAPRCCLQSLNCSAARWTICIKGRRR